MAGSCDYFYIFQENSGYQQAEIDEKKWKTIPDIFRECL